MNFSSVELPTPSSTEAANVTHLDLTECNVQVLESLRVYQRLETLILDKNGLKGISSCPVVSSLETLWCNNNDIEDLAMFMVLKITLVKLMTSALCNMHNF